MRVCARIAARFSCCVAFGALLASGADASPAPERISVQVFGAEGLSEAGRRAIESAVADGVRQSLPAVKVSSGRENQAPLVDAAVIDKALARSDKALREARKRVRNLEDGALDMLDWAADEYARYLPELIQRDGGPEKLISVYAQTAIASYLDGENEAAAQALRRALVLEPSLEYDPKVFPPQLEELLMEQGLLFDQLGKGSVRVEATAAVAVRVFVNGRERGTAPVTVHELPSGPNIVTLVVTGVEPVLLGAQVEGGETVSVQGAVAVPDSALTGPLAGTRSEVGSPQAGPGLRRAAELLGVQGLVVVLPRMGQQGLLLVAHVYDLRGQVLVARSEATVQANDLGAESELLGQEVTASARWKPGVDLELGREPVHAPVWERAYRHKYFWPAVGATAGAVLLTIAVSAATGGLSPGKTVSVLPVVRF